ncbi:MAG: hypothetical protein F4060_07160 [Holophagales bacterium]|nr:hypothetical protein [Holophagales bacterium]MYG31861.1 hypothetical protein [Holophagales bacterium]MYI79703.1 hypothetical protein [Holophagales bacterium]
MPRCCPGRVLMPTFLLLLLIAGAALAEEWTAPRTADGHPDFQGIWANNSATPLERPEAFGEKATLTDEELADLKRRLEEIREGSQAGDLLGDYLIQRVLEDPEFRGFDQVTGNYNSFWLVDRQLNNRTSLVIDPPDGRIPALTEQAMERMRAAVAYGDEVPDGPEDMTLGVRCITFGVPNTLAGYNSYFQFFQTSDHVAILQELIHDVRIVPLRDPAALPEDLRLWHGNSRGWFEGDSLVVETKNYSAAGGSSGRATDGLKVVERFTRTGPDTMEWEITYEDEATWVRPWTMMIDLARTEDPIFEYACHEGNYGLTNILSGARAQEREAAATGGGQ